MFEMMSPRNIILVRPERESIVLHGVRNMKTLEELEPVFFAKKYEWDLIPTFEMK
jgi:hypothetical protein